jgi:putative intracellular protease/amidase
VSEEATLAHALIPIPVQDFDPTEVAVSWQTLTERGHQISFATPEGRRATGDAIMVTGRGLDPWGALPGLRRLVAVGRILRADTNARIAYAKMLTSPSFTAPIAWDAATLDGVDGLLLPGGHRARGMRPYLESARLQALVAGAFAADLPVAAICHGVLLVARSTNPDTGRSVLYGRKTTALTWALENRAWQVARITRFWDPAYYRTYREASDHPAGYMSVQAEVTRNLADPRDFLDVPTTDPDFRIKTDGRYRDTPTDVRAAFVVQDCRYLSARWPGDAHTFARSFADLLDRASAR